MLCSFQRKSEKNLIIVCHRTVHRFQNQ